MSAVVDME